MTTVRAILPPTVLRHRPSVDPCGDRSRDEGAQESSPRRLAGDARHTLGRNAGTGSTAVRRGTTVRPRRTTYGLAPRIIMPGEIGGRWRCAMRAVRPIEVRPGGPGRLSIITPFVRDRIDRIKKISGRTWH